MRVLALVPGGIDDQLRFFPIVNQLSNGLKASEITVVVSPEAKDIYSLSKAVTEVVPYSFGVSNSPADRANLLGIVRDRDFDVVLTGTQSWSVAMLLWLSGIPTRLGFSGGANNWLLTKTVPLKANQPLSAQYSALLNQLNVGGPPPPLTINVPQGDIAAVEAMGKAASLEGGYVLAYPGPTNAGDSYPSQGWVSVLKDFQQRQPDLPVVLIQTPATADPVAAIQAQLPNVKAMAPETSGQLAALIAGANLLISVDSYPLYLAKALDVYALGLLGTEEVDAALVTGDGDDQRLVTIASKTGQLADLDPTAVLQTIWSEAA